MYDYRVQMEHLDEFPLTLSDQTLFMVQRFEKLISQIRSGIRLSTFQGVSISVIMNNLWILFVRSASI